jgi:hypothetical protein
VKVCVSSKPVFCVTVLVTRPCEVFA